MVIPHQKLLENVKAEKNDVKIFSFLQGLKTPES